MDGEQAYAVLHRARQRFLIFRDDDDGRRGYDHPRVLIGCRSYAARYHQADMDAFLIRHGVATDRLVKSFHQCITGNPDIHCDRF